MFIAELTIHCCNIIRCIYMDTKFKDTIQGNQESKAHLCNIVEYIHSYMYLHDTKNNI